MDRKHCIGCRDDFYNVHREACWMRKTAKLETRYVIHRDTPMAGYKKPYQKVRKPACYHESGWFYISKKNWEGLLT